VTVPVVFLEEIVSMGWQEYFHVNFIAHEAQHFADYKTYPKLLQIELEYRANHIQLFFSV